jgi:hypothetical protein
VKSISGQLELSLPFAQTALAVFLPPLSFPDALTLLHLTDEHLQLLENAARCLHRGRYTALVRPKLLQLARKELRLDVLRPTVEQEEVRDIVVLNLISSTLTPA